MKQRIKLSFNQIKRQLFENLAKQPHFRRLALVGVAHRDRESVLYLTAENLWTAGWPAVAVRKFSAAAKRSGLATAQAQLYTIGSALFNEMLETSYSDAAQTLDWLFELLGATIDEHAFLQLDHVALTESGDGRPYQFTTEINAAIAFDHLVAELVQRIYPDGITDDQTSTCFQFAQKTHQFRYYLDWKNNQALRASYPTEKTDLQRLQAHQKLYGNLAGEKARFHNKYQGPSENYPRLLATHGENVKFVTTPYFHSEWIIDQAGHLVTQWNAYHFTSNGRVQSDPTVSYSWEAQRQLVDGNSANFANDSHDYRPTRYGVRNLHTLLDAAPVRNYDPTVRHQVMKKWHSPVLTPGERDFFDTQASEQKANALLEGAG
ncbi:DUF3114 domain-containing protein [Enterococcus sp. CSURQ0835]|uniref:DUF3114 domain-containing protein n=1 Tax=Enterococcus sp. CSURQ0835 TaxID=2681394 RepID=UPI00135916EC|nr:DUF3114 domain-containing protein [Enterococcus sp. CSURQ0835]